MKRAFLLLLSACASGVLASCDANARPTPPVLQSTSAEWSAQNALALAEAADLAYDSAAAEKIKASLRCETCEMLTFPLELPGKFKFEEGEPGPQAFIAAGREHIVIAFRGTEINLTELLTDAAAHPMSFAAEVKGNAHAGFATTFKLVWPDLKPKLAAARGKFPDAKLWITGHSLGGALAVMAAAQIAIVEKQPVQGVIHFGTPVCGDEEFHQALDAAIGSRHWRVVHERDLVTLDLSALQIPFVPVPEQLTRLRHGGKPVRLKSDGTVANEGDATVALTADAVRFIVKWIKSGEWEPPDYLLTRHSIGSGYLPALRKCQGK
jgi:triacylglycerol lipase